MQPTIITLESSRLNSFLPVFFSVLRTQFPGYTTDVLDYFEKTAYSRANFIYWLDNKLKTILVTVDNTNSIVGFAVIDNPYGGVSLCRWLGVIPENQRQGIGTLLINRWLELAKKQGCHKAELAAQESAKDFYEKCGLVCEGKRINSYFGIDQYVFGKILGTFDPQRM